MRTGFQAAMRVLERVRGRERETVMGGAKVGVRCVVATVAVARVWIIAAVGGVMVWV